MIGHLNETEDQTLEELIVVDGNGWLRVPKAYLEQCQIEGRAQLEIIPEGILIRAAPGYAAVSAQEKATKQIAREAQLVPPKGLRRFLTRRVPRDAGKG